MVTGLTAHEIRTLVAGGQLSASDVCRAWIDQAARLNPFLNAFNTLAVDMALDRARELDCHPKLLAHLPLAGVPIAVKDNIVTKGIRTTASSRILASFIPPYNATAVGRLIEAGAVVIGKTNCDEFAMGSSTETSASGVCRNPWAPDRTPGGSSGGSAAAVAARMAPVALGSDTGGSVRQPASFCGVTGFKPTYGRVSRAGLLAFASSLDQIGVLAQTVRDAALVLGVISGCDPSDATSAQQPVPLYEAALTGDIRGLRIGVPWRLLEDGVDPDVLQRFREAVQVFERLGARVGEVDLPHARYAIPVYYIVATAEASSNLARYDGVRYGYRAPLDPASPGLESTYLRTRSLGFGLEVKRRIMLGTYVLCEGYYEAYYLKAQRVRTLIRDDYQQALTEIDAVAMPTSPTPAFKLGERTANPLQMYLGDVFTVSANLAGLPAISLPCGFSQDHLPVGLQLTGRAFDEDTLVRLGEAYQRETSWWEAPPPLPE